jgi:excisionase family DNA binding protein
MVKRESEMYGEFLSVRQAAQMLSVHPSAVYQAISNGRLCPVYLIGKSALRRTEVEAYIPRAYRERKRDIQEAASHSGYDAADFCEAGRSRF